MAVPNRREFLEIAAALGASLAMGCQRGASPRWTQRTEYFPQGVASGDPDEHSVILWTRRPPLAGSTAAHVTVEVADDPAFERVVASTSAELSAASDWTVRILAAGLSPARVYWYRFVDDRGNGSRVGRTITAPAPDDPRPVQFAFVSCQNIAMGAQNAYRRMIFEDEKRAEADRLGFVLHLGDFIYEITWYPEDRPGGYYARRLRDIVRYPSGEKIRNYHIPTTLADYRAVYCGYLGDPDLQDARARWPFVCMWDNHEFSWKGWQGLIKFDAVRPAQTRKVAAAQAWFEFQPARVVDPAGKRLAQFVAPAVIDAPIDRFDDHGLGQEPNNLAAIRSLRVYRSLRWGAHLDLILTDNRSFQMEAAMTRPEADAFQSKHLFFQPEDVIAIFDAGKSFAGGKPPATIRFGGKDLPNPRADHPPQTALGVEQKAWFLDQLARSTATWKVWGNSFATLDGRTDLHNLPDGMGPRWPGAGFASIGGDDWSGYLTERGEIFDFVRSRGLAGFAIVSGDRHAFWAGVVSKALPPHAFDPVGVEFVTGSVSAPGLIEAAQYNLAPDDPLRPLYVHTPPGGTQQSMLNLAILHGVRSCLELAKTGDLSRALALSNRDVAPHLAFLDLGGHGYSVVRLDGKAMDTEFVCIPRPIERSERADGGPLAYRVVHRVALWRAGERPRLERTRLEGTPPLALGTLG